MEQTNWYVEQTDWCCEINRPELLNKQTGTVEQTLALWNKLTGIGEQTREQTDIVEQIKWCDKTDWYCGTEKEANGLLLWNKQTGLWKEQTGIVEHTDWYCGTNGLALGNKPTDVVEQTDWYC